jgi:hypothetical protein
MLHEIGGDCLHSRDASLQCLLDHCPILCCRLLLFEFIIKLVFPISVHIVKSIACVAVLLSNSKHLWDGMGALLSNLGLVGEVNCSERLWIELRLGESMSVSTRKMLMLGNGGRVYATTSMNDQAGNIHVARTSIWSYMDQNCMCEKLLLGM